MDAEQMIKIRNYRILNEMAEKNGILFTGSSLMEQFPVCEMCKSAGMDKLIYNRGVGGFTTQDFLDCIDVQLLDLQPSKIFINIGTNDMNPEYGSDWKHRLLSNYTAILDITKQQLPSAEVILMAYYPVNAEAAKDAEWAKEIVKVRNNRNIAEVNADMEQLARRYDYRFIDANQGLMDAHGNLRAELTIDGIHMYANGYRIVFENLHYLI